jgi:hypothetical protein
MKKQQAIIRQFQKPLSQGQNQQKLQDFIMSGKPIGSSAYLELSPMLQEVVMKLNLSSIEILAKNEKNPFKKLRFKVALFATKKMADAGKAKKELQKNKDKKKQDKIATAQKSQATKDKKEKATKSK